MTTDLKTLRSVDLAAHRKVAEAATGGAWTVAQPWAGFSEIRGTDGGLIFGLAVGCEGEARTEAECEANARFIQAFDLLPSSPSLTG